MPVTVRNADILFNDGSTQNTAAAVTTNAILNAYAGATANAVGSVALRASFDPTSWAANSTVDGASVGAGLSGTWRALQASHIIGGAGWGVYVRIS